jgi:nitrate/nitrite-specific signal transduction histidine kinase
MKVRQANKKERFEDDPCYPLAMLKTAFDLRQNADPHFEEILTGIRRGLDISENQFEEFLANFREDLRKSCKKKGYT